LSKLIRKDTKDTQMRRKRQVIFYAKKNKDGNKSKLFRAFSLFFNQLGQLVSDLYLVEDELAKTRDLVEDTK